MNRSSQKLKHSTNMGRIVFSLLTLLLCEAPSAGQVSESALRSAFRGSIEQLSLGQGSMERIIVASEPASPFRSGAEGYRPHEVRRILESARQNMLQATSGAPALNAYIQAYFPAQVAVVQTWREPLVTVEAANAAITNARNFAAKLSAIDDYTVDFSVSSTPPEAGFYLVGGGEEKTTTTDSGLQNVYRGLYEYRVEKAGYKPIRYGINLVDSDFRNLRCKLHKVEEKEGPHPCQME